MRYLGIVTVLAMSAVGASAQTPPPKQQATTVQQDFEAATILDDAKDYAGALAIWEKLETRAANNKRSLALVRVRKSATLSSLGREDEAVAAARLGLAALPATDPTLNEDRFAAYRSLGQIAEQTLDFAGAAEAYRQSLTAATTPVQQLISLRGMIATETFVDPAAASADMRRALPLLATQSADKGAKAVFHRLNSELLLNQGDFAAAQQQAGEAVRLLGGLTTRTDTQDVKVRSDYAIAALLNGKTAEAREYMAYTGAGRLNKGSFDPGPQMKVPDCGGEAAIKPSDVAVVDFSIGDDGRILESNPVYATGGGKVALEFARAVLDWSFTPEQLKDMPRFFRYGARVELRCSTAFARPSIGDYLDDRLASWLASKNVASPSASTGSDAAILPAQRARLAAVEASKGKDSLELVPVLHALASNTVVSREETNALAARALAIVVANGATGLPRLAIEGVVWRTAHADKYGKSIVAPAMASLEPSAGSSGYAADPGARSAVRVVVADIVRGSNRERARALLQQVADDSGLAKNDPMRIGALIRLASLQQADGDLAAARTAFDQTGLSDRQCALLDAQPQLKSNGGTFPLEAMQWGFEGWTKVQFDIAADGSVKDERAIVSYPPFIFTKAGTETLRTAKFEKTFRPDGGLGCGATARSVKFILPH